MARIAGVDLPGDKRVEIALTYIYGIGRSASRRLAQEAGISPEARMRDLSDAEIAALRQALEKAGARVTSIQPAEPGMEDAFFELVRRRGRSG